MDPGVKHFVRKILGLHLLLLILLLAVVTLAANRVYQSAHDHALEQAKARQALLASQTAHGIASFYNSILGDLNLLKPEEAEESDLPDVPAPSTAPHPLANMGVVRQAVSMLLASQLRNRAYLFLVDETMRPHTLGVDDRPIRTLNAAARGARPILAPATGPSPLFEQEVVSRFSPWLKGLRQPAISGLELIDQRGIKLVCVPLFANQKIVSGTRTSLVPRRTGWLVAAISARPIEADFLTGLGQNNVSGAFLVDESMKIMAASQHDLVGSRLDKTASAELSQVIRDFEPSNYNATTKSDRPFRVGNEVFEPAILIACPLEVMDNHWFVLVASPLKEVDKVVVELSRRALFWAAFVAVSMAGILVSTAAQLISSRVKMERVRHEMLQSEMRQARQIQLAWLPQKTKATCGHSLIDIASLNRPATHISGDFYNFFELPDGRTAVIIGDVTGHGTAAAFLMATTQLLLRNTLPQYCDPGRCLEDVNHQLTNQVFNGQFVTMQVLVIDSTTGEVAIATAGHPAPLLCEDETFEPIQLESQLVAGVDSTTKYPTERFRLPPGACLLLYTDGVVETEDPDGNRLRMEGLKRAISGRVDSAEALLQKAVSAVNTFRRGEELRDDLTMVAIRLRAQQPSIIAHPALPDTGGGLTVEAARV